MRKNTFLFMLLILVTGAYGQTKFESGYIITETGDSIVCQILNLRWVDSPKRMDYRLKENTEVITIKPTQAKKFGIYGQSTYRSFTGEIPITRARVYDKGTNAQPLLVERSIFVEQIAEGKGSLYFYFGGNDKVFLIQKNNGQLEPLLYKQ